jgi:hypothetical protein
MAKTLDSALIRVRVHDKLGALVKMPGLKGRQQVGSTGAPVPGLARRVRLRPEWRELDVSERD